RLVAAAIAANREHLALRAGRRRGERRGATGATLASAPDLAALLAAAGVIGEPTGAVELLLSDRERKWLAAVATDEMFIRVYHELGTSFLLKGQYRSRCWTDTMGVTRI